MPEAVVPAKPVENQTPPVEPQAPSAPSTPSEPERTESVQESVARAYDSIVSSPEPEAGPAGEPPNDGRARDPKTGQFVKETKKPKEPGAPQAPEAQGEAEEEPIAPASSSAEPVVEEEETPPDPTERAPQAWKALARESWAKVPKELRSELLRREKEVNERLQVASRYRQTAEAVEEVWRPYEGIFRMSGRSPLETTRFLFETAAALQNGPPEGKAIAMAQAIRQYGVSVEMLADALNGQLGPGAMPQGQPQAQPQQFRDPRFDAFLQQQAKREYEQTRAYYAKFAETHEFYEDVREQMADIIALKEQQGVDIDDETAYNMAVKLDPELQAVLEKREKDKRAANPPGSTQRARAAAVSLPSGAAPSVTPAARQGSNPRDPTADVAAAWEKVYGGQRA